MSKKWSLTRAGRRLLHELAKTNRVILVQRHPRITMGVRYHINSFPIRLLSAQMVSNLARHGYLSLNRRGFYAITVKGQLEASIIEEKRS